MFPLCARRQRGRPWIIAHPTIRISRNPNIRTSDLLGLSKIVGFVYLGKSPDIRNVKPSHDRPYQATLNILDSKQKRIKQIQTDEEGNFRIQLKPGIYTIEPVSENPNQPPRSEAQTVTVEPGKFTETIFLYDSGIR